MTGVLIIHIIMTGIVILGGVEIIHYTSQTRIMASVYWLARGECDRVLVCVTGSLRVL